MANLSLLTSPPASGKTYLIQKYWMDWSDRVIYLAPLRALCNEVSQSLKGSNHLYFLKTTKEASEFFKSPPRKCLIIIGFEVFMKINTQDFDKFVRKSPLLFIIDEFHLVALWGNDFRPILLEALYLISEKNLDILGLSASLTEDVYIWIEQYLTLGFDEVKWIDLGNMKFKYSPRVSFVIPISFIFSLLLFFSIVIAKCLGRSVVLFCRYRHDVDFYYENFSKFFSVLPCKGGETEAFSKSLLKTSPDLIIGTSCLSHGVNLPSALGVFINYHEKRDDMRLQMLSRGGRRGEGFFTVERRSPRSQLFKKVIKLVSYANKNRRTFNF